MHIHTSPTQKKRLLMQAVVETMKAKSPAMLKEWAEALKEITRAQIKKPKVDGYGGMKISVPHELFFIMRKFIPDFGDDDSDIHLLSDEFPGLVFDKDRDLRQKRSIDKGPKPGWKRQSFKA